MIRPVDNSIAVIHSVCGIKYTADLSTAGQSMLSSQTCQIYIISRTGIKPLII